MPNDCTDDKAPPDLTGTLFFIDAHKS